MSLAGHWWTVWPFVARSRSPGVGEAEPWSLAVPDPRWGEVRLHGHLRRPPGARHCLVLVHGLGGGTASTYLRTTERIAAGRGLATLRFGMRGTEGEGEDLYHAGLSSDLGAAVAAPDLAGFERISLLGFSLGGHVALKAATEIDAPRLHRVAAICSPLDLARSADRFDRPSRWIYRKYVFRGLQRTYSEVARRRELAHPESVVARITRLREWDAATVVPRFGFSDTDDYYRTQSVGPRLGELRAPALLVASTGDPMVDREGIRPWAGVGDRLRVVWTDRGGHVGFPGDLDLGLGGPAGVESQVLAWLADGGGV